MSPFAFTTVPPAVQSMEGRLLSLQVDDPVLFGATWLIGADTLGAGAGAGDGAGADDFFLPPPPFFFGAIWAAARD